MDVTKMRREEIHKCTNKRIGMLIGLYEFGALEQPELDTFLDHLIECDYCYEQVYTLEPFTSSFRDHREAAQGDEIAEDFSVTPDIAAERAAPVWSTKPFLVAASVVVTIGVMLVVFRLLETGPTSPVTGPSGGAPAKSEIAQDLPSPWRDLAIPKAAYTPPSQNHSYRDSTTAFEQAMAAYQEHNFAQAAEQLETLSDLNPRQGAEVHFYWGVSLLLAGRSREAIEPLKRAVPLSVGQQRESSHYYLALAYLKTNQPEPALVELEAVVAIKGQHQADAEKLKQSVLNQRAQR